MKLSKNVGIKVTKQNGYGRRHEKKERNSQQFSFLGSEGVKRIQDASCYRLRLWWETSVQVRDKTPKHT